MKSSKGLHVVVLGPDGSGKSTIVEAVSRRLPVPFRSASVFHLAPGLLRRNGGALGPVTDPHGKPARSPVASMTKVAYWLSDYTLGYAVKVRPKLQDSSLVLFDRYLIDVLVDPMRYRYGGPLWLVRLVWRIVPKPDLVILLDAPAELLQLRKQEVSFEETVHQCQAYRAVVRDLPNGHIVDASQSVEAVVSDVNDLIAASFNMCPVRHSKERSAWC